ncbi:MAG: glycosyltransferase, partial [Hydrogenophaga sp.]
MSGPMSAPLHSSSPLVIVATTGTGGDIQPFVSLAQNLRDRGHRVLLVLPRFHEAAAVAAKLPYEAFGTRAQFHEALDNPNLWDERKGWGVVWRSLAPHLQVLYDVVNRLPSNQACVVLSHPLMVPLAALSKALRPDLHIATVHLAPSSLCSCHDMLT